MKNGRLQVSFDIGGVLSKYPEVFKPLVHALQASGTVDVFVLTDMHDHEQSVRFVRGNGYDVPAENVLNSDYNTHGEDCKRVIIEERGIDLHIDDFPGYCAHEACVSLFVWPNSSRPYYDDSFVAEGGGDFGRRCKKKA